MTTGNLHYYSDDEAMHTAAKTSSSQSVKLAPRTYRWDIAWHYVLAFVVLHAIAVYGIYILICGHVLFKTFAYSILLYYCSGLGITAGAHRLWAHRTYKARLPLRILLAVFQTMAFQYNIFQWVRDHRMHHKYTDTDADPYNASRGVFFSHIGWLMLRPHPDVLAKRCEIHMTDVAADPVVKWQRKYYAIYMILLTFLIPALIPYWFWNENFLYSFAVVSVLRYLFVLHITFLVNSAAHIWGMKPYDKNISPVENPTVAVLALGEGWHNYHHTFPWDYKAAELGNYRMNITTAFIEMCAHLGLAYDLKTADAGLVAKRTGRTGGCHKE